MSLKLPPSPKGMSHNTVLRKIWFPFQVVNTFLGPFLSTLSLAPWTLSDLGRLARFSDQTILFSDSLGQATTGPRDTTQREPNWSTLFSMW